MSRWHVLYRRGRMRRMLGMSPFDCRIRKIVDEAIRASLAEIESSLIERFGK